MGNVFNRYGAGGGKSEGIYIWKKCETASGHALIGYVVSDDSSAYPDKETKDGYYYEKVSTYSDVGISRVEIGTFTPTSSIQSKSITHSLGVLPKYAYVWTSGSSGATRIAIAFWTNGNNCAEAEVWSSTGIKSTTGSSATTTTATLCTYSSSSYYFYGGQVYKYVLLA